jgi:hypothetical protein
MITKLRGLLYWLSFAFLLALFGWILIRSGHDGYLWIVVVAAALKVLVHVARLTRVAALLRRTREHPAVVGIEPFWRSVRRMASHRRSLLSPFGPAVFVGIAVVLRVWWATHFEVHPFSDYRLFFEESTALSQGDWGILGTTKSPVTVLFYSAFFKVCGASLGLVYAINGLLGAVQALLTYSIARRVFVARAPARLAGLAVAVFPSLVMANALPSSEVVFCVLLLVMVRQAIWLTNTSRVFTSGALVAVALLLGFETAALHLTRNTGVLIGGWLFVVAFVWVRATIRTKVVSTAAFLLCTTFFLTPQIVYNYKKYGYLSIQSSKYAALNLLSGTTDEPELQLRRRDLARGLQATEEDCLGTGD